MLTLNINLGKTTPEAIKQLQTIKTAAAQAIFNHPAIAEELGTEPTLQALHLLYLEADLQLKQHS